MEGFICDVTETMQHLRNNAGTHSDPRVVEAFLRMVDRYGMNELDLAG